MMKENVLKVYILMYGLIRNLLTMDSTVLICHLEIFKDFIRIIFFYKQTNGLNENWKIPHQILFIFLYTSLQLLPVFHFHNIQEIISTKQLQEKKCQPKSNPSNNSKK